MHVQNLMNSFWDIRIFFGLIPKESPCIYIYIYYINTCLIINRYIPVSNLKFQYTVQFQWWTAFTFTHTSDKQNSLVPPYSFIVFLNITLAFHLTMDLPIHILPWKPTFSTDSHRIHGAVSFVIAWKDHLSLRIVWLIFLFLSELFS